MAVVIVTDIRPIFTFLSLCSECPHDSIKFLHDCVVFFFNDHLFCDTETEDILRIREWDWGATRVKI